MMLLESWKAWGIKTGNNAMLESCMGGLARALGLGFERCLSMSSETSVRLEIRELDI